MSVLFEAIIIGLIVFSGLLNSVCGKFSLDNFAVIDAGDCLVSEAKQEIVKFSK